MDTNLKLEIELKLKELFSILDRDNQPKTIPREKLLELCGGHNPHRWDWTQDMLPDGWRPLLLGEKAEQGDEIYPLAGNDDWKGKWQTDVSWWAAASESMFPTRTRRPLPSPAIPVPEGWRELRDDEKDGKWIDGAKYLDAKDNWTFNVASKGCYAAKESRIIVPVAKPRVPLGSEDSPPGSALQGESFDAGVFNLIVNQNNFGVHIVNHDNKIEYLGWVNLMAGGWKIKRPTDTEWQPCSKEAES